MECLLHATDDGLKITIVSNAVEYTAVVPAPFEADRAELVESARRKIVLNGYLITDSRRLHNKAFDREGEQTTTELTYRPCRDKDEARLLLRQARDYLVRAEYELGRRSALDDPRGRISRLAD